MNTRRPGQGTVQRQLIPALALGLALAAPARGAESPGRAAEVLAAIDGILALESFSASMVMETREADGTTRSMSFDTLSRRDRGSYLEVLAPARSKGIRFLQLEGSLWMYNPKSGSSSALRLSARESFQGSTFSNADVGKNRFAEDYEPSLGPEANLEHAELGKVPCLVLEGIAKSEEAAYGKILVWARKTDLMPLKIEYFAKSGLLFKTMELSAIKDFGGFLRPSVMRMESLEKKGRITTLTLLSMTRREVPLSAFSKVYLTR